MNRIAWLPAWLPAWIAASLAAARARRETPADPRLAADCGAQPPPERRYLSPMVGAFLR